MGSLVYMQERNKQTVFETVTGEFEKSGLTLTELAKRTGRDISRVSKFLAAPGNWTLNTISDYLFAISGARLEYQITHPLKDVAQNSAGADWIKHPQMPPKTISIRYSNTASASTAAIHISKKTTTTVTVAST